MDTVTIAIPVYNGRQYLPEAISSAQRQTRPADELVVWDNASTDGTIDIARQMLSADQVQTSERNMGAVANFDRAALAATTDWFMWLASDDRLHPDYIRACLSAASAASGRPRAILTGIQYIDADGNKTRTQVDPQLGDDRFAVRARHFLRKSRWTECYCLYRTVELQSSPLLAPEYGADVLLTWWFILRGPLLVVDVCLLEYREVAKRTVAEMAKSLMGSDHHQNWRKVRIYYRMWTMARDFDIPRSRTWIARREIFLAMFSTAAAGHLEEDFELRLMALDTERRSSYSRSIKVVLLRLGGYAFRARQRVSLSR